MKSRLKLFFSYLLFWVALFICFKILFVIYHSDKTGELSLTDTLRIFIYGFRMDLSMASYLVLPLGLMIIGFLKSNKWLKPCLTGLTFLLLIFTTLLAVIDMELYRIWGFRLDATPILYVTTNATGATALGDNWIIIRQVIIWLILVGGFGWVYTKWIRSQIDNLTPISWKWSPVILLLTASLILPIRGTLGMTPMNSGFVYFHETNLYANHAALNVVWNVGKSVSHLNKLKTPTNFFDSDKTQKLWASLYSNDTGKSIQVLNTERPNILIIALENYTSKFLSSLDGKKGVAPRLDSLVKEGILFKNFYANGDRTERGILSILSAYPPHPTTSLIKFPNKTQKMDYISQELKKLGYSTGVTSGYDLSYANFRSYFGNAGFEHITSQSDFSADILPGKWGIDDHYVFEKLLDDINSMPKPFLNLCITLSSHHPFEVPMETVIEGEEEEVKFMNSAYYTDQSLGKFIDAAKEQPWWNNTLIIITADHGNILPENVYNTADQVFKIPMIWAGGALAKRDTVINNYGSQNDIAKTVMGQLGNKSEAFKFSRDLLTKNSKSFAFFTYNNGFGLANDSALIMYDNVSNKFMTKDGAVNDQLLDQGKACMQMIYTDLQGL